MSDYFKPFSDLEHQTELEHRRVEYFAKEMTRLKTMEVEYRRLLDLISVVAETNPLTQTFVISVTKQDAIAGKDWREILELALKK